MNSLWVMLVALLTGHVAGHPHGAPTTACDTMYPLHKHSSQTSLCPFETRPYQTEIFSDSSVKIALHTSTLSQSSDSSGSSSSSEKTIDHFTGYMIMAMEKSGGNVALGTFEVYNGSHTINCHGMSHNAATHSSKSHKSIVHLTWTPPADFEGDIVFKTTFVASKKTFWVKQESIPVHVKAAASRETEEILLLNDDLIKKLSDEVTYLESTQYISLWAVCSFFIVSFSCAVVAKLILASRSKKYANIESI